jgi:glutamate/tyrosine decarboxylase-like PLP-dependent enzyme
MHQRDASLEVLTQAILRYAVDRMRMDPPPLDNTRSEEELRAMAGHTVVPSGLGGLEALRVFADVLGPACISTDHPRYLSFVPAAPTEAALLFDLVVGASCIYGGSWLEGAGAVFAENEALRWLADLAGLPQGAGGVFVSGGSAANLSGLVAARHAWRTAHPEAATTRGLVIAGPSAHSSVVAAARVMDVDVVTATGSDPTRLTGRALADGLAGLDPDERARLFVVVATAGSTNAGLVDDLRGIADVTTAERLWLHVDGAYGGAALAASSARHRFDGIELADSFVVDPHKWLFAPFDCAALLYREPEIARRAHVQHAEYLDVLTGSPEWNPSDFAYHLTRRARGLPFWFSLATHGTAAYARAIEQTLELTAAVAELISRDERVELVVEPELSIVVFRRLGWNEADYDRWSRASLDSGLTLTVPTSWQGETVLRFCFVNPRTTLDDVAMILDSLA